MQFKQYIRTALVIIFGYLLCVFIITLLFANINQILIDPPISPVEWLEMYPHISISTPWGNIIWMKPSSTVFIYGLGILTLIISIQILRKSDSQYARGWWGISLILWGIGALAAGTSYQAFSYAIKCQGRSVCQWTSLWEIMYLLLTVASINAMIIAHVYSFKSTTARKYYFGYALFNMVGYTICLLIGTIKPLSFLISFEFMILCTMPGLLYMFIESVYLFRASHTVQSKLMIQIWLGLGMVMIAYYGYLLLGITDWLWVRGIWFSENDILHIGLILWMIFLGRQIPKKVYDYTPDQTN